LNAGGRALKKNPWTQTACIYPTLILEDIGHAPMIEAPAVSARHYMDFLQSYEE
jgi:hypothetical protein